jgi:hypothetical protein
MILQVADVAAQLKLDLAQVPLAPAPEQMAGSRTGTEAQRRMASESARARRTNALRTSDSRLQRAIPSTATRAGSNNAHFLLARRDTGMEAGDYAALTLRAAPISAPSASTATSPERVAEGLALGERPQLAPAERAALARAVLADEASRCTSCRTSFAAGPHRRNVGGCVAAPGTHDFYNQNGIEVFTWAGGSRSIVLMGDAHMRREDA